MALAMAIAQRLQTARWPSVLPSIIDAAERDMDIAALHGRLHAGRIAAFGMVIERAAQRGKVAASIDPSYLIAAILGPLFYRRWFSREPLDAGFVKHIVASGARELPPA